MFDQNSMISKKNNIISFLTLFVAVSLTLSSSLSLSGCSRSIYPVHPIVNVPPRPPKPKPIDNVEIALALGTGGFRGIAHVGVLEVLEKEGIPIDLIVGTSAGSMVGAFYCAYPKVALMKEKVMALKRDDLVDSLRIPLDGKELERFVSKNLPVKNFEQLKIPLVAVATSLNNNQVVLLRSGPIVPAVHASSAMPHFFAPLCLYGHALIDGGVTEAVPVDVARKFHPKMVIGVNVYPPAEITQVKTNDKLFERAIDISYYKFCTTQVLEADVAICPDLKGFQLFDDKHNKEAYEKGKRAAYAALPKIKEEMARRGIKIKRRH